MIDWPHSFKLQLFNWQDTRDLRVQSSPDQDKKLFNLFPGIYIYSTCRSIAGHSVLIFTLFNYDRVVLPSSKLNKGMIKFYVWRKTCLHHLLPLLNTPCTHSIRSEVSMHESLANLHIQKMDWMTIEQWEPESLHLTQPLTVWDQSASQCWQEYIPITGRLANATATPGR